MKLMRPLFLLVAWIATSMAAGQLPEATNYTTYRPRPDIPYQMVGKVWINRGGTAVFDIDEANGKVIQVTISRSTGVELMDRAAVTELKTWRFRPHTVARAATAILFREPPVPKVDTHGLPNGTAYAIYMPAPVYPTEARRVLMDGDGLYRVDINPDTGLVTNVSVITSTKVYSLDRAAKSALKQWKFRPHTITQAAVPFNFRISIPRAFSMHR